MLLPLPAPRRFVVIGSTGNHYTVIVSDAARKCQCMDCRIRKRDCKHIKLILNSLGIADSPTQWRQVRVRCLCEQALMSMDEQCALHTG